MALQLVVASSLPAGVDKKLLQAALRQVDSYIPKAPKGKINLKLVDDRAIQALNKNYSGIDKATDVLSFSYIEDASEPVDGELGDVAVSLETATRQAQAAGLSLNSEITLLLIHGCLHILGYDHAVPADQAKMDHLQAAIMAELGLTYRDFEWDLSKV